MATPPGNKTTLFQHQICVKDNRRANSHGLFFADDPFESVLPVTLCQIILAIAASRLLNFILRPLRTPLSICNILGGIVMGPSLFGRSKQIMGRLYPPRQAEFLATAAALSAVFFVFSSTLKMNISASLRAAKGSWRFGLIPFLASFWVISILFNLFGRDSFSGLDFDRSRVIMSFVLSLSSFPVVSQALSELNLLTSELGQIALSTSIINDITQWLILAGFSMTMSRNSKTSIEIFFSFWALLFFCVFVVRPAMIAVSRKTPPGKPVKESYIVTILVGVLAMAAITDSIGVNYLHGPLLLGAVMPNGPPLATTLVDRTEVIITQILLPLLYVFIGMHTDVSLITNWNEAFKLQVIIIASCLAKLLGCVLTSLTYKIDFKHGLMLGLILNIKGIVELIVFNRWRKLESVGDIFDSNDDDIDTPD
ncbi:hypothetical protein L6164_030127 [Bauhinia variegata]|uniref:Uncharacterized protein n=1 Tax=Bauhinia variegata TaxID=167791 RepID=A0ACB9LBR1_BAUVA|nr:hypothetical protein L6164_030127 [Bauhinia variegata]